MSARPPLAPDAAMVLGLVSTAVPFALTPEEEAERWLRILRLHGEAGIALQALGVSEVGLLAPRAPQESAAAEPARAAFADERGAVADIAEQAERIARRRGASGVTTTDLLVAAMQAHGAAFDRVLRAHGTDREEVLERLGVERPAPASS
jgi:hypothetical protein